MNHAAAHANPLLASRPAPAWRGWLLVFAAFWASFAPAWAASMPVGVPFDGASAGALTKTSAPEYQTGSAQYKAAEYKVASVVAPVGPKNRVWDFFADYAKTHRGALSQVAGTHKEKPGCGYETASGRSEGSNSDPASLHKYNYAHGNPVSFMDPSGHMISIAELAIGNFVSSVLNRMATAARVGNYLKKSKYAKTFASIYKVTDGIHQYVFVELEKYKSSGGGVRIDYGAGGTADTVFGNMPGSLVSDHDIDDGFSVAPAKWGANANGHRSLAATLSIKQTVIWAMSSFGLSFADFDSLKSLETVVKPIKYNLCNDNCVTNTRRAIRNAKLIEGLPTG